MNTVATDTTTFSLEVIPAGMASSYSVKRHCIAGTKMAAVWSEWFQSNYLRGGIIPDVAFF